MKLSCIRILMALLLILMSCASPPLTDESAVVVTQVWAPEALLIKEVKLRNAGTGEDVVLRVNHRRQEPIVAVVSPGSYYFRRVETWYANVSTGSVQVPDVVIEVRAGSITYLGDLFIDPASRPPGRIRYGFARRPATLDEARALKPALFTRFPAVHERPGLVPAPEPGS